MIGKPCLVEIYRILHSRAKIRKCSRKINVPCTLTTVQHYSDSFVFEVLFCNENKLVRKHFFQISAKYQVSLLCKYDIFTRDRQKQQRKPGVLGLFYTSHFSRVECNSNS